MLRLNMAYFNGRSGKTYNFLVYPMGTSFKKGLGTVYCVTNRYLKKDRSYVHGAIYFGQAADLSTEFHEHPMQTCFAKYGASCACIREESDGDTRLQVVQDLIDNYDPPCNKGKEHE